MRWWWNLTLLGKAAVLAVVAGVGLAVWTLSPFERGITSSPEEAGREPGTSTPAALPGTPALTPGGMAVGPSPTPSPAPTASPTPTPSPTPVRTPGPSGTPRPGQVVESVRVLYTTCEGDGACGIMASGRQVHPGAAACNRSLVPFGTRLRIQGWDQELVCEDIHPNLTGWYVVVWFATEAEGRAFRQRVGSTATVEILSLPGG